MADFGIAVLSGGVSTLTRTGHGLGTLGYVAPEQQYRLRVDERADQFSLAAIAYELLTGEKALGVFKPPSQLNPRLGLEVNAVIMRALDDLLKAFVQQDRMKLPGGAAYVPCYRVRSA